MNFTPVILAEAAASGSTSSAMLSMLITFVPLFAVFYFDLDGKFLYYIWEPLMIKRFDNMKRPDATAMPYSMKESVEDTSL